MKGLTLFEFNEVTKELKLAKFRPGSIFISASRSKSTTTTTEILVKNENCLYVQALNKKNAERKIKKLIDA